MLKLACGIKNDSLVGAAVRAPEPQVGPAHQLVVALDQLVFIRRAEVALRHALVAHAAVEDRGQFLGHDLKSVVQRDGVSGVHLRNDGGDTVRLRLGAQGRVVHAPADFGRILPGVEVACRVGACDLASSLLDNLVQEFHRNRASTPSTARANV